jgi:anti-sigma B factor antagonist
VTDPTSHNLGEHPVSSVDRVDGALVVHLIGELDLYNAPALRESLAALVAEAPSRVVIDLEQVEFVDSTALGVLIEARSRLDEPRGFLLAAPGIETSRALQVSGLDRHLGVHATVEEALRAPLA